jgi:hypothetical protein
MTKAPVIFGRGWAKSVNGMLIRMTKTSSESNGAGHLHMLFRSDCPCGARPLTKEEAFKIDLGTAKQLPRRWHAPPLIDTAREAVRSGQLGRGAIPDLEGRHSEESTTQSLGVYARCRAAAAACD